MYAIILGLNISFHSLTFIKHGKLWIVATLLYFSKYFSHHNSLLCFWICQIWQHSTPSQGHLQIWGLGWKGKALSLITTSRRSYWYLGFGSRNSKHVATLGNITHNTEQQRIVLSQRPIIFLLSNIASSPLQCKDWLWLSEIRHWKAKCISCCYIRKHQNVLPF